MRSSDYLYKTRKIKADFEPLLNAELEAERLKSIADNNLVKEALKYSDKRLRRAIKNTKLIGGVQ